MPTSSWRDRRESVWKMLQKQKLWKKASVAQIKLIYAEAYLISCWTIDLFVVWFKDATIHLIDRKSGFFGFIFLRMNWLSRKSFKNYSWLLKAHKLDLSVTHIRHQAVLISRLIGQQFAKPTETKKIPWIFRGEQSLPTQSGHADQLICVCRAYPQVQRRTPAYCSPHHPPYHHCKTSPNSLKPSSSEASQSEHVFVELCEFCLGDVVGGAGNSNSMQGMLLSNCPLQFSSLAPTIFVGQAISTC
jgi:hypothetical protein